MLVAEDSGGAAPIGALLSSLETYDAGAQSFAEQYEAIDVSQYAEWMLKATRRGGVILDAGCGTARDAAHFIGNGVPAVGLDLSLGMLGEAQRLHPEVPLVRGDVTNLPLRNDCVDGVWAMASLVHLDDDQTLDALHEFTRVVRSNGWVFVSLPLADSPAWRQSSQGARWFRYLDSDSLLALASAAGLTVKRIEKAPGIAGGAWINVLATPTIIS